MLQVMEARQTNEASVKIDSAAAGQAAPANHPQSSLLPGFDGEAIAR